MKRLLTLLCFAIALGFMLAQSQEMKRVPVEGQDKSVKLNEKQKVRISDMLEKADFVFSKDNRPQIANLNLLPSNNKSARISTQTNDVVFSEDFENAPADGTFPAGWTNVSTPGGNGWTTDIFAVPGHSGSRYANILFNETVDHDAWVYTPGITFTAGATYKISFWVYIKGYGGNYERMEVKIGTDPTSASMTQLLFDNNNQDYDTWTEVTAGYTPTVTGTYHIGFHSYSPADVNISMFDDVMVETVSDGNDIKIVPTPFYTQVPVSQILPPLYAKAINMASETQTNVTFSATLNGTSVGSSTPVASLATAVTSDVMTVTSTVNVPAGDNTLMYSVTADATDDNPANNTVSYSFTGTDNVYAVDEVTDFTNGTGSSTEEITFGNIFEITVQTAITQAVIGFADESYLSYNISLYSMTGDMTVADTPLFTQTAERNTTGLSIVDVPETDLPVGRYYLCVNQLNTSNISVSCDVVPEKVIYMKNGNNLTTISDFGAAAIRMIIDDSAPAEHDAGVIAITSPTKGGSAAATVTATVKNNGSSDITSMPVAYKINNGTPVVETFTGNLAPSTTASFTFTTTADLSAYGDYKFAVYTQLPGDEKSDNDTTYTTISYHDQVKLYGYRIYDDDLETIGETFGFVSFSSSDPTSVTVESTYRDGANNALSSGVYSNRRLYGFTRVNGSGGIPHNLITLGSDWSPIGSTPITYHTSDATFDASTNTLYVVTLISTTESELATVDINTGERTPVATLEERFITLACKNGQLYGISYGLDFYKIDKTTGDLTLVGATGVAVASIYMQSMAFDYPSGRLFWALSVGLDGLLMEVNTNTGEAISLGVVGNNAEIVMLYTPFDENMSNTNEMQKPEMKIYPNPVTDKITVEGSEGAAVKIYSISGKILLETTIQNNKASIDLSSLTSGIYFIELQGKETNTTKKFIKK